MVSCWAYLMEQADCDSGQCWTAWCKHASYDPEGCWQTHFQVGIECAAFFFSCTLNGWPLMLKPKLFSPIFFLIVLMDGYSSRESLVHSHIWTDRIIQLQGWWDAGNLNFWELHARRLGNKRKLYLHFLSVSKVGARPGPEWARL